MSVSILERLEARLSAKPAVISIETLFSDLLEARDAIDLLTKENEAMKTAATPRVSADQPVILTSAAGPGAPTALAGGASGGPAGAVIAPHIDPGIVAHIHTLLTDAKERLSVNALGTVASHIESAIKLLEDE